MNTLYFITFVYLPLSASVHLINPRNLVIFTSQKRSKKILPHANVRSFGRSCGACIHLQNFTPWFTTVSSSTAMPMSLMVAGGGGKYIMSLVKLSFYDHFMVARGPSMLSTYRCAFLTAVLGARAVSSRISFIIRVGRTL